MNDSYETTSGAPCLYRNPETRVKCYKNVAGRGGYCKEHQQKAWFNPGRERPTQEFLRNRKTVIARAKGQCENQPAGFQRCTRRGKEVDHKIPKAAGGVDALFNLQLLCEECHKVKTRQDSIEGIRRAKGKLK